MSVTTSDSISDIKRPPSFQEAAGFWLWLGCVGFGGPAAQIALMQKELVEKRGWISDERFQRGLGFCSLLPGPEAMQLATYIGLVLHGTCGAIAVGFLFVFPAALLLWGLSWLYMAQGTVPWIAAMFEGLPPAIVAIMASAFGRLLLRLAPVVSLRIWAVLAFALVMFFQLPYGVVLLLGAGVGVLFAPHTKQVSMRLDEPAIQFSPLVSCLLFAVWCAPVLLLGFFENWSGLFFQIGLFFSKAAMVTFGGAYSVLPYVADHAVNDFGWLSMDQLMAGLALAETTPGPLIIVLQFFGFVAGWQSPGGLPPLGSATIAAALTTWTTFVPALFFVQTGAPFFDRLGGHPFWRACLTGINATIAALMLKLAFVFARHSFITGDHRPDWASIALAAAFYFLIAKARMPLGLVVLLAAIAGVIRFGM